MKMLLTFFVFLIIIGGIATQASVAHGVTISAVIPGSSSNTGTAGTAGPGDYINNFYQFALLIGGVLALAVVVYGGILYMTSVGNPSGQSEAKAWLEAALMGILLLAGAYLILNIINPQLVNLTLPSLQNTGQTVNQVTVPANNGSGVGGSSSNGGCQPNSCPVGQTCTTSAASGVTTHTCLNNSIVQPANCAYQTVNGKQIAVCTGQ